MADKPFDPTLKSLVEVGPIDWTVFSGDPAAPTRIIDADIATVSGAADKVLRVEGTPPYILHLEFVAGLADQARERGKPTEKTAREERIPGPGGEVSVGRAFLPGQPPGRAGMPGPREEVRRQRRGEQPQ